MATGPDAVDDALSSEAPLVAEGRRSIVKASSDDVRMMTIGYVVVAFVMITVVVWSVESSSIASTQDGGHPSDIYREDDDDAYKDCQVENGKCFNNQHCCHGYICLHELDQALASESEAGLCRRRDPNQSSCHSDDQCPHGSQCIINSDNSGQGFCQTMQTYEEEHHKQWSQHMYGERKGGLGSACQTTSDCNPFTMDGSDRLCCQDVRRGRQGTKRMCDRVTGISVCIQ